MPRKSRLVIPGLLHHVTQRGSRRQPVFFEERDRELYLDLLLTYAHKFNVLVPARCLMTNHIHLGLVPQTKEALKQVLKPVHMRYAQEINARKGWAGHLWQARFYSSPVETRSVGAVIRYILRNPVRAGMVQCPSDYKWSNAHTLLTGKPDRYTRVDAKWAAVLDEVRSGPDWLGPEEEATLEHIRLQSIRDLPIGSTSFIEELERRHVRCLRIRAVGRPKKSVKSER